MSTIPIVPAAVAEGPSGKNNISSANAHPYQNYNDTTVVEAEDFHGNLLQQQPGMQHEKQPNQLKDVFWAILFLLHFIPLILYALFSSSSDEGQNNNNGGNSLPSINVGPHLFWLSVVALVSVGLSSLSLEGMMRHADVLVKISLVFSVLFSALIAVFGILSGNLLMSILGAASFAIGCCYASMVWHRLPFAAANLRTALSAVRSNMGLVVVAYLFMVLAFGWSLLFFLGFGNSMQQASYPVLFCWLVSYYWVHQVLQYTVHVVCAGVVGTWWFAPAEASSFFSAALQDSMVRATTYSFGSICFGAFVVALVRALRVTLQYARQNDDAQFLVCILECILRCIEDMIDYINRWAYVYVGLYGMDYLTAGREVINLFQQKGWTVIITDDLVDNVLFMMSVLIGLIGGLAGLFMGSDAMSNAGVEEPGMMAFGMGFLMGYLFASIALGVVASAVNTVIVCYCEAPAEFQQNHPQLSNEMRTAWTSAWPELNLN